MKKIIGWGFASVVALLALGFIALEFVTDSMAAKGDFAIAAVRSHVEESVDRSFPSADAGEMRSARRQPSSGDCEDQLDRWLAMQSGKPFNLDLRPTELERRAVQCAIFLKGHGGDPAKVPEEDWAAMRVYVDSRGEYLAALKAFARTYEPTCDFPTASEMVKMEYIWLVLPMELALGVSRKDYALAVEDLICMMALRCTSCFPVPPYLIVPQYAALIVDALRAGVVEDESWAHMLRLVHERRGQDFMEKYVARYPHVRTATVLQEAHFIKEGIRSMVRKVRQPTLNNDAARFAPLMTTLTELSSEPYYKVESTLRRLTDDYDLTYYDPEGYRSQSAAHASVIDIVHHVFPENAMAQLQLDVISLAIALGRHRVRYGRYPESLDEAAELFGEDIPVNPLTGSPYDYASLDGGYRLGVEFHEPTFLLMLNRVSDGLWIGPDGFE